jgi:hypothetical protein
LGGSGGNWLEGGGEDEGDATGESTGDEGMLEGGELSGERRRGLCIDVCRLEGCIGDGGGGRSGGGDSKENGTMGVGNDCLDKDLWRRGDKGGIEGS